MIFKNGATFSRYDILKAMQEYAEEYHQSELLKLNKSDVISSVCTHEETVKVRNKTIEICKKCGLPSICV